MTNPSGMRKTLLLASLYLLGAGLAWGASPLVLVTVPGKSHEILRVSKDNQITLVKKLPGSVVESTLEGSTAPLPSPDGKKIAYLQGNNLFIQGLPKGAPQQVTKEGFSNSKKYRSVYPLLSGWSRDSSQVLYYLTHTEEGMEGEEEGPALETKDLAYGYYFYDASAGVTQLPGMEGHEFCGWTSKEEALLLNPNGVLLYAVKSEGMPREITFKFKGANVVGQVFPGPGDKALALAGDFGKWSQVVELDLTDGNATVFSAQGGWADFNRPSYSPSGKRSAWLAGEREDDGQVKHYLVVDKAIRLELKTAPRYEWLDDARIAVVQVDKAGKLELLVVDASGGNTLARKGF